MAGETVWLVGLMGAGKSAVGRRLAARLSRQFLDSDVEIERETRRSVAEIFELEGEAAFRRRERDCIDAWGDRTAVVALGGGAMAQEGVPALLAKTGRSIYLRALPETLAERVGRGEGRPLLAGLDGAGRLEKLTELLGVRGPSYDAADLIVDTDGKSADAVAAEICAALGEEIA